MAETLRGDGGSKRLLRFVLRGHGTRFRIRQMPRSRGTRYKDGIREVQAHFTVLTCALASGKLDKPPTTEELSKNLEEPRAQQRGTSASGLFLVSVLTVILSRILFSCRIDYIYMGNSKLRLPRLL